MSGQQLTLPQALQLAMQFYQQGQLDQAANVYQQILAAAPQNATALHMLGVMAYQRGESATAVELLEQSVAFGADSQKLNHLGAALFALNRIDEAIDRYRESITRNPDYPDAYSNLGVALQQRGDLAEAEQMYQAAIRMNPEYAEAYNNLGIVLRLQGRLDEAANRYMQAMQIRPNYPDPLVNLAGIYSEQSRFDESIALYRQAVQLAPDRAGTFNGLGLALKRSGNLTQAADAYRQALHLDPQHDDARSNLVAVHVDCEELDAAQSLIDDVVRAGGDPLWEIRRASLCPTIFESWEAIDTYRAELLTELERLVARPLRIDLTQPLPPAAQPPYNLQFQGRNDRQIKQAYAKLFEQALPRFEPSASTGTPRIGFFVSKWHERAFLKSCQEMLERIEPSSLEMAIVCSHATANEVQTQLRKGHIRVVPVPDRLDHLAETVLAQQFDVLYHWEIGTDSLSYLVPLLRLAPVQCTSWGIHETSGAANMDYYITSQLAEPPEAADHYSEQPILLETELSFQHRLKVPQPEKRREDFGFSESDHLYACMQQLGKFHPDFDAPLGEILRQDPHGKIVLSEGRYPAVAEHLKRRLQANLPDVFDRLVFMPRLGITDYLSLLARCDVVLDTFHFVGGFTTFDAFSFNKPVVTWPGEFRRGRFTAACYRQMGYERWIADTHQQWSELAVALGTDSALRSQATAELAEATGEVFENQRSIDEHERVFHELARRRERFEPARGEVR